MSDSDAAARQQIFARLRKNLRRGETMLPEQQYEQLQARITQPQPNLVPQRAQLPHNEQVQLFIRMAELASASVQWADNWAAVPKTIAEFILRQNLPGDIVLSPDPLLTELPWIEQERLRVESRLVKNGDRITVTPAFAGIAETGTLMLLSSEHRPSTMNFLPDVHIAVLEAQQIVGPYEEAWQRLRQQPGLPRTINLITGPSRSGDIEQTLQLGAHGPIQSHIVIVGQ